jgi:hypothetical protein
MRQQSVNIDPRQKFHQGQSKVVDIDDDINDRGADGKTHDCGLLIGQPRPPPSRVRHRLV